MSGDPRTLVTFEAIGERFTAVFGFKAVAAVEAHYDKPLFDVLRQVLPGFGATDLVAVDQGDPQAMMKVAATISFSDVGKLLQFSLLKHHPDVTDGDIAEIIDDVGFGKVVEIVMGSLSSSSPLMDKEGGETAGNPQKRSQRGR